MQAIVDHHHPHDGPKSVTKVRFADPSENKDLFDEEEDESKDVIV